MKNGEAARRAAQASAASRRRRAPLQKVVARYDDCEELECGHALRPLPRGGLFGSAPASRRRCLACLEAQEKGEQP